MRFRWTPFRGFLLSILIGVLLVVVPAYRNYALSRPAIEFKELTPTVWVTSQISLDDIHADRLHGVRSLVDLRPDGEAFDQPSAKVVGEAIKAKPMAFDYIPVPHGRIPADAVASLQTLLDESTGPVLLYCRSGNRAARTWALAEASRRRGAPAAYIRQAVASAGFSTQDIDAEIDQRIAARPH